MTSYPTSTEAFAFAKHKSRYAHKDCAVWCDNAGVWFAAVYSRATIKAAMLATGTTRHWYVISGNTGHRIGWREANIRLRNVDYLLAA